MKEKYITNEIYIGQIGFIVSENKGETRSLKNTEFYVAFEKVSDKMGKDLFTDRRYLIWEPCTFEEVRDKNGKHAIGVYMPVEEYMSNVTDEISSEEIIDILNRLNNKQVEESERDTNREYVSSDLVLNCIYETYGFLKSLEIDREIKLQYVLKLKKLGKRYVEDMAMLKKSGFIDSNDALDEAKLRRNYLIGLVNLEDELKHIETISVRKLKKDEKELEKRMTI